MIKLNIEISVDDEYCQTHHINALLRKFIVFVESLNVQARKDIPKYLTECSVIGIKNMTVKEIPNAPIELDLPEKK